MPAAPARLLQHRTAIETTIGRVLQEYQQPTSLYDPVRYLFDAGGKRIRPLLVTLSAEACGATLDHAVPAAAAVELLHTFTLVHDDIMDRSALRRGRPTVHMKWNDSVAILSGDVMMGMAMRLLQESAQHAPRPLDVISAFSTGLIDVCDGQALDMEFQERSSVTEDEYMDMITKKTAKLLEMSVAIGAGIAGASAQHATALRAFALGIGVAFQMQDDILDLTGGDAFGKTPGGDVLEGKKTWLILSAQRRATQAHHRALIGEFFANNGLPKERIADVQSMCDELGVLEDARRMVEVHTTQAFHHLHSLPVSEARYDLEILAQSLMQRTT